MSKKVSKKKKNNAEPTVEERQENKVVKDALEHELKHSTDSAEDKEKSKVGKVQIWVKQEKIDLIQALWPPKISKFLYANNSNYIEKVVVPWLTFP